MYIFINKEDPAKDILVNNYEVVEGDQHFYIKNANLSLPKSQYKKVNFCLK